MVVVSGSFSQRPFLYVATVVATLFTLAMLAANPILPVAHGQDYVELTPELDARAANLYAGIMCPICSGQTISQSHAQISETMREMVRERLVSGDTDDEIYAFMVAAFGQDIIASPPTTGLGLAVWVVPPVAILLGAVAVAYVVRQLRAPVPVDDAAYAGPAAQRESEGALGTYLDLVDREMGDAAGEKR
jgi:cytochrome c-type biogenesis protein CcmH